MTFDKQKFIAFDVETSGTEPAYALQPHRVATEQAWITSFATAEYDEEGKLRSRAVANPTRKDLFGVLEYAATAGKTIVAWNAPFDVAWLMAYGCKTACFLVNWADGELLWKHAYRIPESDLAAAKRKSYSLKAAVAEFIPEHAGYEEEIDFHDNSEDAVKKRLVYNRKDAIFTLKLAEKFYNRLTAQQLRCALLEAKSIPSVAEANLKGLPVATASATLLSATLVDTAESRLVELAKYGATPEILASPSQLATLLFETWDLPVLKQTTKGADSTDKEVLHELGLMDTRARLVRDYREALNNRTKFAEAPIISAEYNGDGRTRPAARIAGTYTGRMTFASKQGKGAKALPIGFAIHQMKRGKDFRSTIEAPEGYTIAEFDAAGQEFRWMAIESGDETMLGLCLPGEDPHSYMGAQIAGYEYREMQRMVKEGSAEAEASRQLGKVGNLSCIAWGQPVLTDRGYVPIQEVLLTDKLWDGTDWATHQGVVHMGQKETMSYGGIEATPDHRVLVQGQWVELKDAARHGWAIESPLGQGWAYRCRAAVRLVGGFVSRAVHEVRGAVLQGAMLVRHGEGREPADGRSRPIDRLQELRIQASTRDAWALGRDIARDVLDTEACRGNAASLHQPIGSVLPQLRGAWDRVSICVDQGLRRLRACGAALRFVCGAGHRQDRQQRPLRAREPATGYTQGEPRQQAVFDILEVGARHSFVVGPAVVHNCQYRTSAKKLRVVARVQYYLPMEEAEAYHIHRTYHANYQGVQRYWARQIARGKRDGYIETLGGRRVLLEGPWTGNKKWALESTAINFPIQGVGADQKYLAIACTRDYVHSQGGRLFFELHDGLYFLLPDHRVADAVPRIQKILNNLPYKRAWGFTPPVPLPWDVKIGKSWGTLVEQS